jgi:hypothetical protein
MKTTLASHRESPPDGLRSTTASHPAPKKVKMCKPLKMKRLKAGRGKKPGQSGIRWIEKQAAD